MPLFFAEEIKDDTAFLYEDADHMQKTLRLRVADAITVSDGRGFCYPCRIETMQKGCVQARVLSCMPSKSEPSISVTLYQSICKGARFEVATQKCTELGVKRIVPLHVRRCEMGAKDMDKRRERLQKIAREAAKQCGRAWIPTVEKTVAVEDILAARHELLLCPYEEERMRPLKSVLQACHGVKDIGVVIGPEGGFEPQEIERLAQGGGQIVTLGPRILRTETASPAVLSVLMYEFGQWDGGQA